jgi:hypothetical protein
MARTICILSPAVVTAANQNWVRPGGATYSCFRAYFYVETGAVRVKFQEWALEIKRRPVQSFGEVESPLIRKVRE